MAKQETTQPTTRDAPSEERTRPGRTYLPNVDICETEEALWLWADMPGVDDKSVEVELDRELLSIHGRVSPAEYENLTPLYTEYNVGDFERRFRISSEIDTDRIRARVANGVLELELPKAERARRRRIEIAVS